MNTLKRIIASAIESIPDATSTDVAVFLVASEGVTINAWLLVHLIAAVDRARQRVAPKADPRQAWLDLPEFQHIPAVVQSDTLEQYRERIKAFERRIHSYALPRRSTKAAKADKRELREMQRLESKIAPLCVNDPAMTVGQAVEAYRKQLAKPMVQQRKKAIKSRWSRRTQNQ